MEVRIDVMPTNGGARGEHRVALDERITLGRGADCAIMLDAGSISREHFSVHADGNTVFVTDLSANGTSINGVRIRRNSPQALNAADVVSIPGFEIVITPASSADAAAGAATPAVSGAASAQPAQPEVSGRNAMLSAVFGFIGSFTAIERFLAVLSLASLALLAVYVVS